MMEVWKKVRGYDGRYEVSSLGRVRSYANGRWGNKEDPIVLKQRNTTNGYLSVYLRKSGGKAKDFRIHRLVAEAFVSNPDAKPDVNHIDGDKHNNCAENLEWVTKSENSIHAFANGLATPSDHQKEVVSKLRSKPVIMLDRNGCFQKRFASITKASNETGIDRSDIARCCKGKAKTAGGHKWEYENNKED